MDHPSVCTDIGVVHEFAADLPSLEFAANGAFGEIEYLRRLGQRDPIIAEIVYQWSTVGRQRVPSKPEPPLCIIGSRQDVRSRAANRVSAGNSTAGTTPMKLFREHLDKLRAGLR